MYTAMLAASTKCTAIATWPFFPPATCFFFSFVEFAMSFSVFSLSFLIYAKENESLKTCTRIHIERT